MRIRRHRQLGFLLASAKCFAACKPFATSTIDMRRALSVAPPMPLVMKVVSRAAPLALRRFIQIDSNKLALSTRSRQTRRIHLIKYFHSAAVMLD